jgi:hypothetical protein
MSIKDAVEFCERIARHGELRRRAAALIEAGGTAEDLVGLGAVNDLDFTVAELQRASTRGRELSEDELESVAGGGDFEDQLNALGDDAQLANVDLQNALRQQQETLRMMSNISKMVYDTSQSVIRKIGG